MKEEEENGLWRQVDGQRLVLAAIMEGITLPTPVDVLLYITIKPLWYNHHKTGRDVSRR